MGPDSSSSSLEDEETIFTMGEESPGLIWTQRMYVQRKIYRRGGVK